MSADEAYNKLMESLGFPGSKRLRPIMEELMTPDQAQMVAELPGSPEEVAQKTGFDPGRVKDTLDELFFKGVIFPRGDFRRRDYFRFARSIGQFHDSTMATEGRDVEKDREFYELWYDFVMHEMYPQTATILKLANKPFARIIPAYKSIKDLPGVLPCENYQEILKEQELIAVVPCSCRYCTTSVGKQCTDHDEVAHWVCLQFGRGADYAITRESGRELSLEEALELNEIIEEDGLLHIWPNNDTMIGPKTSCNCCRDCCMIYVPMDQAGLSIGSVWEKSRFQASVIQDDCTGCQECVDRCKFDAIEMVRPEGSKKYKAVINAENCFGCGACAVGCEPGAIKMEAVRPPEHIPGAPVA